MRKKINKYKASFVVGLSVAMEYRVDFFMQILSAIFPIAIQVFLWLAIYQDNAVMYGYSFPQMIMYVCAAAMIGKFVATGIEGQINGDIHSGELSKYLIKPASYLLYKFAWVMGSKIANMTVLAIAMTAIIVILVTFLSFHLTILMVALFILSLLLAIALNFFIYFCISTLAFHLTEVGNFFFSINIVMTVLSGGIFPIEVFGETYIKIFQYLPFIYTINFPIRVITGTLYPAQALNGILVQLAWIAILSFIGAFAWQKGVKKYVAVGG